MSKGFEQVPNIGEVIKFRAFENPPFDFATKYAVYTKTITSAAFFAPLCPMAMVWAVIGLIGSYWIDKVGFIIIY